MERNRKHAASLSERPTNITHTSHEIPVMELSCLTAPDTKETAEPDPDLEYRDSNRHGRSDSLLYQAASTQFRLFSRASTYTVQRLRYVRYGLRRFYRRRPASFNQGRFATGGRVRSPFLRWLIRWMTYGFMALFLISAVRAILWPSYTNPPERYRYLAEKVAGSKDEGRGNPRNERVYIAANILNKDLIRGAWGKSLLELIDLLGSKNVFVSIYENDSGSGTAEALQELQSRLPCYSSVVTGGNVSLSDFPTVRLPNGEERVQRLTYLAEIRNRLLRPLDPVFANDQVTGYKSVAYVKFNKILFLNDVYFSPLEAVQLLFSTNADSGVAKYRAACAMDFVQLSKVYDTFVVRDTDGYQMSLQYYPWFTHLGSAVSRSDALRQSDAIRVRSCWGGMAAFDADIFQPKTLRSSPNLLSDEVSFGLPSLPIKFRGSGEPFWEAAECCLVFADIEVEHNTYNAKHDTGVYLNPYVSTAYSATTWRWVRTIRRFERIFQYYQYLWSLIKSPEYNPRRTHKPGQMVNEVVWVDGQSQEAPRTHLLSKLLSLHLKRDTHVGGRFKALRRTAPAGGFCGQRRFFVMKQDIASANSDQSGRNWEKVRIPPGARTGT